jgi:phosphinothricin acetyltransferase
MELRMAAPHLRSCVDADMPAVTAIYAHFVRHGTGTFEEVPPSLDEMRTRRAHILADGMPYLVAELDGAVVGYAYATVYRARSAYRFTAEDSIYVHHEHGKAGIGSALLAELIERCEADGCRQMVAIIGDRANRASIALHERFGFRPAGELEAVGFKFGQWIDTIRMQRALGAGNAKPPRERGGLG